MTTLRRPLNYYGSKEKMCPEIHALIPEGPNTWVDLFCGSAVVTLKKPRHQREVINDLNGDVINLFTVLGSASVADLYRRIELTPYAEELLQQVYAMPPTDDAVERAWRFLVCSWFGRGGDAHKTGFRWSKTQTTAPELTWARLPDRLIPVAERLRGVCIRSADALKIVGDYDHPECILFVDPPYPGPVGRRYAVRMDDAGHRALADRLVATKAKVILTMNPETVYGEVLADWHETPVLVQGGGNAFKREVILTNYPPPRQQFEMLPHGVAAE
ncbi:DNA adenine methylase [Azospirillum baldaniorum]|uniref:DNA adenine methylase n=1 Tax=Azospirillum baldaniorum TaxID=1064539 RepID=UPI0011A479F1|nr:DNA adenine methylase [Azospirillum baldaniorum]TWA70727.1 DNA adenine methylase [Azospirillum baldaniorum]